MLPSSLFTNRKGTHRYTIITAESPYIQFQGRSEAEFFWIASTTISNMDSYHRLNADSVRNVGLLTWCLQQGSCKRSVWNRTLTSTRLMLIWTRNLTRSAETFFVESWQNTAAPKKFSPPLDNCLTACMQGCNTAEKAPEHFLSLMVLSRDLSWLPLFSASSFLQCCLIHLVARMLESTFNNLLMALSSASEGFKQRPKGEDCYRQRVSVRRRLCTERYDQSQHTKQCWQVLNGQWKFWPNHQHKKDRGGAPAILKTTKIKVYRTVVLTHLLYG